jgi:hypothetical protein
MNGFWIFLAVVLVFFTGKPSLHDTLRAHLLGISAAELVQLDKANKQ